LKNEEFIKLKNSIARKSVIKILLYSLGAIILFSVLIDGVYNDELADSLANINRDIYYWCVANKIILLGITYLVIFAIISFFVIRNTSNNMVEIIKSMDQIIKEPEKEVKLSNDLILLESKLNNIRVDLVSNQNKAKEALQKKNDLIMYMAHDLKTPLTSIIGYLTLLTDEKEIPENLQKKYMDIALKKSLRLEELTNQFFNKMCVINQKIYLIEFLFCNALIDKYH
jgi:two-component system sensor histidine kinase VanS